MWIAPRAMTSTSISAAEVPDIQMRLRGWIQALQDCQTEITRLQAAGMPTGGILADLVPLTVGLTVGLELLVAQLGEYAYWHGAGSGAHTWSTGRPDGQLDASPPG